MRHFPKPRTAAVPGRRGVRKFFGCAAIAAALIHTGARGQQLAGPHIGYVFPAGGRQGSTFQVKLGGQFLDGVTNAYVSGPGVRAVVLGHTKPLTQAQFNALRDRLKELQQKRAAMGRRRNPGETNLTWTAADAKAFQDIRTRLAGFQRRPPNPAIAETVSVQVDLAADAQPGRRELRVWTPQGLSNPLVFCVDQLPEISKPAPRPNTDFPNRRPARNAAEGEAVPATETSLTIPAIANGQILQGGVDRYRFTARRGQKLVLAVKARQLIPYIADAVPGWFQPTLTLRDGNGKELAYADDFLFHPDPVLYHEVDRDGQYVIEIKDAIFRGREDFVYRLCVSELPFLTGLFPLGGPALASTTVSLAGWNLPTNTCVEHPELPGVSQVSLCDGKMLSNKLPFASDTLPEISEQEPNDTLASAQAVSLPVIINGRVGQPGDADVFRFTGRAGQTVVAEVSARRLGSPLDSVLTLLDAAGHQVAFNDDHEDKGSGLNTHHADSYLLAILPASGDYCVRLQDAQRHGGLEFAYRLRLSPPRPGFELRVVPSSVNLRAGFSAPLTVYALRQDGFTNEIKLELDDAPVGFSLSGARIPPGHDSVVMTLAAPGVRETEPVNIVLQGNAFIDGRRVSRRAVPADDMMQAFAYRHLVPAEELKVAISGRAWPRSGTRLVSAALVRIPAGGSASVHLNTPLSAFTDRFSLEVSDAPDGLKLAKVQAAAFGSDLVFEADGQKLKAGQQGNLIVHVVASGGGQNKKGKAKQTAVRRAVGVLPAIPFEIVETK